MNKLFIIIGLMAVLASCQKEIDGGTGGGSIAGDYQPVTANSEWNYTSTSAGNYNLKALGTDTTINGRRFYKFDRVAAGQSVREYISKVGGVYRNYAEFAPAGQVLELVYLKDSAVGTNWTNTITAGGFSNYHKYTVSARDMQRTVNGVTFNNVIELNYEFTLDNPLGGGVINAGGGKQYYAKNVGAIESFFTVGFLGFNVSDTTRLVSYTIR
jgi:hypothetical protein